MRCWSAASGEQSTESAPQGWRDPLASFVFPDLDGFPDLNGAISCFLAPAVSVQSARFLCSLRS